MTDQELFQALQAKQPGALKQLYDCFAGLMYSLAVYMLQNPQDAEDLVQDILVAQWQNCTYNPARGSIKTYLLLLVRSRALDRLRTRQAKRNLLSRFRRSEAVSQTHPPDESVEANEVSQRVRSALSDLPENQRQAILLAYFEGCTQQEISDQFGVPLGTVKSWFRLGFTKLRRLLHDLVD